MIVDEEGAGLRLDVYLFRHGGFPSRARASLHVAGGRVWVNDRRQKPACRLKAGDRVRWLPYAPPPDQIIPMPVPFDLVYADDDLLVVNKPAGVVVHPGAGRPQGTLVAGLLHAGIQLAPLGGARRPGVVHRLDRQTSGLLVVAKHDSCYARLQQMIGRRQLKRNYLAVIEGCPSPPQGRIETPYGRHPRARSRMSALVTRSARRAATRYRLLARGARASVVEVSLETGRTHQIRVHLALIGHPIAGDKVYGRAPSRHWAARQLLHAWELAFVHPRTGRLLSLCVPPPTDFREFCESEGLALPPS